MTMVAIVAYPYLISNIGNQEGKARFARHTCLVGTTTLTW